MAKVFFSHTHTLNIALFLIVLGVYLLSSGGHIYVKDGGAMFFMTQSLVDKGWFDVPLNINTMGGKWGPDGRYYTPFGILHPLCAIPFFLLGRLLMGYAQANYFPMVTITWFNCVITALLVVVFFQFLKELRVRTSWAVTLALGLAFSTPFWVYSRTFFSEPLASLAILLAARYIFLYGKTGARGFLIASGFFSGVMLLVRPLAGAALPMLFLYLVLIESRREKSGRSKAALSNILLFAGITFAGVLLMLGYNHLRFGSVLETGYDKLPNGQPRNFTLDAGTGLNILLFSPGKSIFIFAPLTFVAILGAMAWSRREERRPEAVLCLGMPAIFIAVLCRWVRVEGGVTWGPRLLLPAVPVMLLAAGAVPELRFRTIAKRMTLVLLILGVFVQIPGIIVNFSRYINQHIHAYFDNDTGVYNFSFNPIAGHYRMMFDAMKKDHTWEKYPYKEAVQHRRLIQINFGEPPDFWWIHLWRDRLSIRFITGLWAVQFVFLAAGLCVFLLARRQGALQ